MRYTYHGGADLRKKKSSWTLVLPAFVLLAGGYVLYNTLSPAIADFTTDSKATAKKLVASQPAVAEDRIYMPQINVDVPVVAIAGNESLALEKGAIHRSPESGNPKDGGNFVLAAHRFSLGVTPEQTRAKSPFYHIDKLNVGDQLYVDYGGIRYAYEISEKKQVPASAVNIESRSEEPTLTVYSCGLGGLRDNREVIVAKALGKVAWVDGVPKIQTF